MKKLLRNRKVLFFFIIIILPLLIGSSDSKNYNNDERFSLVNYTVFTPGSDVQINLYSYSQTDNYYKLRLFKVNNPADFFLNINRNRSRYNFDMWGNKNEFLLKYTKLIKEWKTIINPSGSYWRSRNVDVGKIKDPGYYILQALKGNQVAYCGISVTDLAVVYKKSENQLLAFTANSISGEIQKNVKYSLYTNNKLTGEKNSNEQGTVLFNLKDTTGSGNSRMLLIAKTSKQVVLSDPYFYFRNEGRKYTAYIYTNQPVYRPGQEVFFKALIRMKNGNGYKNITDEKFSVKIKAPKNKHVYSGSLETNEFGALSGSFKLDDEADLGRYSIQVIKNNLTYYGSFDVEEYKKPEYFVKVETGKNQYAVRDTITADIHAGYYFGSPVTNAKVNVKVYRQHYWRPWWYWSDYSWFYKRFAGSNIRHFANKELITEQTGKLDNKGNYKFVYDTPLSQDADYIYIISADVTDNSRSTITGQTDVYVTRGSFSISTSPERYFVSTGSPVGLRVNASDFENRPVKTDFKIVVKYPGGSSKGYNYNVTSDTLTGSTGERGNTSVTFMPKVFISGHYIYKVYAKDEKGRMITASGSFYVGNIKNYYSSGLPGSGLEIVTDKDTYNKGDSLTAYIFFPQNNMDVLVSFGAKDFLHYKVYHVDDNSLTVKLKLTDKYSPSFNIDVAYLKDNRLNHTSKLVGVLDKEKLLTVKINPSKEIYKPGEEAEYILEAKDSKGRPVKNADLSIGVVDESIYAIKEDETPNIKTFFYAPEYSYIPTNSSLQNQNYNGTSRLATVLDTKINYKNLNPKGEGNLSGKLITKRGEVKFNNIYVMLSGDKYFYKVKPDTSGHFEFKNIKPSEYDLIALLDDGEFFSVENITVKKETTRNIDLGNYSNINPPGIILSLFDRGIPRRGGIMHMTTADVMQKSESLAAEKKSFIQPQVRSKFADAAFWKADVVTDSDGKAKVSFKLPDNLTTWRATVRGITVGAVVGQDTNKIISRKNLLVRLETPRFFREGDELVISTIVHNYLKNKKEVKVGFNPGSLALISSRINQNGYKDKWNGKDHKSYLIPVKNNSEVRIDWKVKVSVPIGEAKLKAEALTNEESDAVEIKVPVLPEGIKINKPIDADYSGNQEEKILNFNIPNDIDLRTAKFTFSVAPSLAGTMLKSIDDLVGYPYGCVEQTMSRFLPSIIVANTFKTLNAPLKAEVIKELPKVVNAGLKRLYGFQHTDGGWGWWENDKTNPYMTAYVIYGMTLARNAGYKIDSTVFENGLANLEQQIKDDKNENFTTQAYMIYSLITANENNLNKDFYTEKINNLLKEDLNPYALSLLALSLNKLGIENEVTEVLNKIIQMSQHEGSIVYWGGKAWHYSWHNDKVQSTAYVVKALLLNNKNDKVISEAVRWLLLQKQGFSWHSTQETATVLFALTDYLKHTKELSPNYNVEVYLNNKKLLNKNYAAVDVFNNQSSINIKGISSDILKHGNNKIKIMKKGKGTVYFSGIEEYYSKNYSHADIQNTFEVTRKYFLLKPENQGDKIIYTKQKFNGKIKSGDILLVKTHIATEDKGLQYFILEDMLPSGFEPIKDESKFQIEAENFKPNLDYRLRFRPWFYADKEYRDDRVSFFVTNVNQQMDFSYIIRAEIPGDFNVSPAKGYLMYYPEIAGNSKSVKINVTE